jgi:hypothetical protein
MSAPHHGNNDLPEELKKHLEDKKELFQRFREQATGQAKRTYSEGRKGADDEGDLAYMIGPDESGEFIKLDFNKSVEWIGLPPANAIELAQSLIKFAREISKEPITVKLH